MSDEDNQIYSSLSRKSQLCLKRLRWKQGRPYHYRPRSHLLSRLAQKFGISREEVMSRLFKIREFVTTYPQYY